MPLPEDRLPEESAYNAGPTFNPYDPEDIQPAESVQPTPSPAPSSDTAPDDGDTREQTESRPTGGSEKQDLPQFDRRFADDFVGLLYLGRLDKTFRKFGHTFVVRTLTTEQMAEIAQIVKPHAEVGGIASAEGAVYQSAVVAASVVTVDGQPLPGALTMNSLDDLRVRTDYVMRNWMPPVREKVYDECIGLELVARQALSALGEASG